MLSLRLKLVSVVKTQWLQDESIKTLHGELVTLFQDQMNTIVRCHATVPEVQVLLHVAVDRDMR